MILSIAGDACEYMTKMKESLLQEVNREVELIDDYHFGLRAAMNLYWDNFSNGSTDYITLCQQCNTTSTRSQLWCELIMYFPASHYTNPSRTNTCSLGEMLHSYNTRQDDVEDYYCGTCNRTTTATVRNHVRQYPKVLAIAISRGADNDTVIESCVNYPIENFTPYTHSDHQLQDDTGDATFDLVAIINYAPHKKGENGGRHDTATCKHKKGKNGGGHYTATCKQHNSGLWYDYNDDTVITSSFSKRYRGVLTVKNDFQRRVALMFTLEESHLKKIPVL
jgi:ubiquitin C-terminal hydrolase